MAHELDKMADGTYTMARADDTEITWHGLENVIPANSSFDVWLERSGMNFEIGQAPVQFQTETMGVDDYIPAYGKQVLYRKDNNKALSVVSDKYNIVQPRSVMEFFQDLCADNKLKMDTAGVIRGGMKFWALARTGVEASISNSFNNDRIMQYILMATSADMSMATTVKHTTMRVVCSNTLHANLDNHEQAIKVPHSAVFDADEVKMDLGVMERQFDAYAEAAVEMHKMHVTDADAKRWYCELLSGDVEITDMEVDRYCNESRLFKLVWTDYNRGAGAEATMWGVLNGLTHTVDHTRGRSEGSRLDSQLFGTGAALKAKALKKAVLSVAV